MPCLNSFRPNANNIWCKSQSFYFNIDTTFKVIAPLSKKIRNQRKLAPWYSHHTWKSKIGDKLEHHQTEGTYRKALRSVKTMCNTSPVAENNSNLRFLFSTVAYWEPQFHWFKFSSNPKQTSWTFLLMRL